MNKFNGIKESWHRHVGAYGICMRDGKLLVIRKSGGPYTGRYDLPGGSLEPNETVREAVVREFAEETGIRVEAVRSIGHREYVVAWKRDGFSHTHCHHIALLYEAEYRSGSVEQSPNFDDSDGAEWIAPADAIEDDLSPLVRDALKWVRNCRLDLSAERFDDWHVREGG